MAKVTTSGLKSSLEKIRDRLLADRADIDLINSSIDSKVDAAETSADNAATSAENAAQSELTIAGIVSSLNGKITVEEGHIADAEAAAADADVARAAAVVAKNAATAAAAQAVEAVAQAGTAAGTEIEKIWVNGAKVSKVDITEEQLVDPEDPEGEKETVVTGYKYEVTIATGGGTGGGGTGTVNTVNGKPAVNGAVTLELSDFVVTPGLEGSAPVTLDDIVNIVLEWDDEDDGVSEEPEDEEE